MPDQQKMMTYSQVSTAPISQPSEQNEQRIQPDPASSPERPRPTPPSKMTDKFKYESTADGDIRTIVVEEASFDVDEGKKSRVIEETINAAPEPAQRTPIKKRTHTRDLSAHFFDATRLSDGQYPSQQSARQEHQRSPMTAYPSPNVGQKHRRGFSGDVSNPVMAHRRMNSVGDSQFVGRSYAYYGSYQPNPSAVFYHQPNQHRREDSAGLDMLSIAAEASKDDARSIAERKNRDLPSLAAGNSPSAVSNASSFEQPAPRAPFSQHGQYSAFYGPQQHGYYDQPPHYRGVPAPPCPSQYPVQYAPPRAGRYILHHKETYGHVEQSRPGPVPEEGQRIDTEEPLFQQNAKEGHTRGVQTFVTSIAVGEGVRTMKAAPTHRTAGTNTEYPMDAPIPSTVSHHHRKDSSYSSLATIMGSGIFPDPNEQSGKQHYRTDTAGSMSFLKGLDNPDEIFLANINAQPHPQEVQTTFSPPRPVPAPSSVAVSSTGTGRVLAQGGTSKRVRRKCTVDGCPNRVVQGGLCIAHGAKRKQCKHPGCTKNVKKAGLCSTHGPARKRCEFPECPKVAVQGGRCIAHGAKKKLCSVAHCTKQAIMSGMCKKHHDHAKGVVHRGRRKVHDEEESVAACVEINKDSPDDKAKLGPSHQRGLSIFQEMSADTVSTLLSADEQASESSSVHPLKM